MKFLSLSLPGGNTINPPLGIRESGLEPGGAGQSLVQLAVTLLFTIGLILTVVFIILSGIQWIMSSGEKEKVQKARARLTYSIIGMIIIVGAFFIINTVISILGGNPAVLLPTS